MWVEFDSSIVLIIGFLGFYRTEPQCLWVWVTKCLNWICSYSIKEIILTTLLTLQCFHSMFLDCNMYSGLTSIHIPWLSLNRFAEGLQTCIHLIYPKLYCMSMSKATVSFFASKKTTLLLQCLLTASPHNLFLTLSPKHNTLFLLLVFSLHHLIQETKRMQLVW